jgi:Mn2+/Fe2+ NRAMP family transporter
MKFFKNIGPATLIAAAFIGPGTVSICAIAGIDHAFSLIWVLLISMLMTIFLQELSARLAITYQKDLIGLIKDRFNSQKLLKYTIYTLIFIAIVFGNAAYEAGNLSGINIGLDILDYNDFFISITGVKINYAIILVSGVALFILHLKSYKYIERTLMVLVGILSLSFVISAFITTTDLQILVNGILSPKIPKDDFLIIAALIGTTVVPYNLFLHASLAKQKWPSKAGLKSMQIDTIVAVSVGVLVSICIIITTANVSNEITEVKDLGVALEPLFGRFSSILIGIGYMAAGLTSAVTAPLAAAYVINSLFSFNYTIESSAFKRLSYIILFIGCVIAALDFDPVEIIRIAQISNAIVLPVMVFIILWLSQKLKNSEALLSLQNLIGFIVLVISLGLSLSSIYKIIFR